MPAKSMDTISVDELMKRFKETASEVVPWFYEQMPEAYFQDTLPEYQLRHLSAIIGMRTSGAPPRLTIKNQEGTAWIFIHEESRPGILAQFLDQLPRDRELGSAKVHTGKDGHIVLDVFRFVEALRPFQPDNPEHQQAVQNAIAWAREHGHEESDLDDKILRHARTCNDRYFTATTAERFVTHWRLCRDLLKHGNDQIFFKTETDPNLHRVSLVTTHMTSRALLERLARHMGHRGFDIHRAYLDAFTYPERTVQLVTAVLGPVRSVPEHIAHEVHRLPWVDERTLKLTYEHEDYSMIEAELTTALIDVSRAVLGPDNPHAHSKDRLRYLALDNSELTHGVVVAILKRFDPKDPSDEREFRTTLHDISVRARDLDDPLARMFMLNLVSIARGCLKLNIHVRDRFGVAMRLDPSVLHRDEHDALPFGVFFVHGPGFAGFHVRFRDVARGGVRVVRTRDWEAHAFESRRVYDEAYGLAHAQQLKNKDIPEGGSKAVVLTEPGADLEPAVHGFVDGLLDLIVPESVDRLEDRLGETETLYLGPDENITPAFISWIVDRAEDRKLPNPLTFMSSKPNAGINHKEYGVTSEGVIVYLEHALLEVGIDPRKDDFTVKLTGGPDGDVGGNCIKILHREFGSHARIVAVADGRGTAVNPDGLDMDELLRLVDASESIDCFDRSKLSGNGKVVTLEDHDGIKTRNNMHNDVYADAFIPAGGRPRTIDGDNWSRYVKDGVAQSRIIVEGANLFLTPEARRALSQGPNVLIIKDSSANKCGVICSSFEILASMLLTEDEFLSVKADFVSEVLVRLRRLARQEAESLLDEHRRGDPDPIPDLCVRLSKAVSALTDAIADAVRNNPDDKAYVDTYRDYIPRSLMPLAADRIMTQVPVAYRTGIIASTLATTIVYSEGLSFVEGRTAAQLAQLSKRYVAGKHRAEELALAVADSNLPYCEEVVTVLKRGGARILSQG